MYRLVTWRLPPSSVLEDDALRLSSQKKDRFLKPVEEFNSQAPPELCQLIHQCLEIKASRRPQSMGDVEETLELLTQSLVRSPEDRLEALEW